MQPGEWSFQYQTQSICNQGNTSLNRDLTGDSLNQTVCSLDDLQFQGLWGWVLGTELDRRSSRLGYDASRENLKAHGLGVGFSTQDPHASVNIMDLSRRRKACGMLQPSVPVGTLPGGHSNKTVFSHVGVKLAGSSGNPQERHMEPSIGVG